MEQNCHKGNPGEQPHLNHPSPFSSCAGTGKAVVWPWELVVPPLLPGQMGAGDLLETFWLFHLSLRPWNRACRDDPGLSVSSILPIYTKLPFPKVTSWQCLSRGTCPVTQPPDETATSLTEERDLICKGMANSFAFLGDKSPLAACYELPWEDTNLADGSGQSLCRPACQWEVELGFRQRRNSRGENRCKKFLGMLQKSTSPPLLLPNQPT